MEAVLARQGVTRMGAAGEPFDPERHEAVGVRPDGRSFRTARSSRWRGPGYMLGDRVLRPAEVVVARAPEGA